MPNKEKLPLFITKLVSAKWDSGAIRIEFNAGGDEVFTRFLSAEYSRDLAFALLRLLAERAPEPAPPLDDIQMVEEGENIRFSLLKDGKVIMSGLVTKGVGEYAHQWLTKLLHGPNVALLKTGKKRRHG